MELQFVLSVSKEVFTFQKASIGLGTHLNYWSTRRPTPRLPPAESTPVWTAYLTRLGARE